jgi:hypothetical protein
MARIFSTPEAEATAKVFMHNITVAGGINTKNLNQSTWPISDARFIKNAQVICTELINRDFTNIDQAINSVANFRFQPNYSGTGKYKSMKSEAVAKAIVYMAERLDLYWDDTIRTPYEIDEFKKTILGEAVYKYSRYISAVKDKTTKTRASTSASANAGTANSTTTSAPQNGYKSSGPQSGNVRGLIGNPGEKVYADGPVSYRIEGDKIGSNTPRVFIKPLTASGAAGNSNKIYISSGNGYTDCTCFFDDPNEAQKFLNKVLADLNKLIQDKRAIAGIANLHVAKVKSDANGYFLVNTEYGYCAVSARTLNEAVTEALKEDADRDSCWEKATEGCTREELEELHAWMRRD